MQGNDVAPAESAPLEPVKTHRRHRRAGSNRSHSPLAPRQLLMAPQDLGVLMQKPRIELIERVAGLMRIPAIRHRRHTTLPPRPSRSNVRSALAFATASRPDLGLDRASRRNSATASRSGSPMPSSGMAIRGVIS
jgi:hypothetical protein